MEIRAVLFDLDGTLVDSERESAEGMARALERDHGLVISQAARDYVVGHSWNEIEDFLRGELGDRLTWSLEELIRRSAAHRAEVIAEKGLPILPGAKDAIRRFGGRWPKAIVTGSSREEAMQALRALDAVADFPLVVAAEDYEHGKPSPEGYLRAARELGVPPGECLVLEDSAAGIAAGRAAGAIVVAIRAANFLGQDQSAAHAVVETLDDVTFALVEDLARQGGGA
jgi:HAD superfamily hydrolase (TIGR01509 family)